MYKEEEIDDLMDALSYWKAFIVNNVNKNGAAQYRVKAPYLYKVWIAHDKVLRYDEEKIDGDL